MTGAAKTPPEIWTCPHCAKDITRLVVQAREAGYRQGYTARGEKERGGT